MVNPHLSIFRPYESIAPWHEDQLTRAAMIMLRLIPLACESLLRRVEERSLAQLPTASFDTQVGSHRLGADPEKVVSVFLTPDETRTPSSERPDDPGRQRLDGVIRFEEELVVVIESKLHTGADDRQWIGVSSRTVHVSWHELLEDWLDLDERRLLAPAEREALVDFFEFADEHFSWLLPFSSLSRAGSGDRRWRRLVALLGDATHLPVDEREQVHVRVSEQLDAESLQRIALEVQDDWLEVRAWPGESNSQAECLYPGGRARQLLERLDNRAWRVYPNFHLSFRNAHHKNRLYLEIDMPVREYVERIAGEDWWLVGQKPNAELGAIWTVLEERGYASRATDQDLERFRGVLGGARPFYVRPGLQIVRGWPLEEAIQLDDSDELASVLRESVEEMLAALDEPRLPKARHVVRA
jgi:hypothetical protein